MSGKTVFHSRGLAAPAVIFLAACAAVFLGSCGLFTASAFPSDLNLIQAQADVSPYVSEDHANDYTIGAVDVGESRYVFLMLPWGEADVPLLVLDGNLNLVKAMTRSQAPFGGTQVFTDAGGHVVIGNGVFSVSAEGLTFAYNMNTSGIPDPRWDWGFSCTDASGSHIISSFYCDDAYLRWFVWTPDGSGSTTYLPMFRIDNAVDPSKVKYMFDGVYSDPDAKTATLVLVNESTKTPYFVTIPWSDFISYSSEAMAGIMQYYASTTFTRTDVNTNLLGYTGPDGNAFITFSKNENSSGGDLIRFKDGTATPLDSFHYSDFPDARAAFPLKGDAYYVFDKDKLIIRKIDSWWK